MNLEESYLALHSRLVDGIKCRLHCDVEFAEEIASRVWLCVCREQLKKYDPSRSSLLTYLMLVAKGEWRQLFRAEHRRKRRQKNARRVVNTVTTLDDMEFENTLTPAEANYYRYCIGERSGEWTDGNRHQLQHRVRQKVVRFFAAARS